MVDQDEQREATSLNDTQKPALKSIWNRIEDFWNKIQVGRQGSYSVERLELLENYCRTTSTTRVFLVCVVTPLPVLTVAVLLECLPLRSPAEGWAANWMFWIRLGLMVFTLSLAGFSQMNTFIPGFNLTATKMITASLGICVAQVGTYLFEGAVFGFPVPFMWQLGAISMAIYAPAITRLVFGPGLFQKNSLLWLHHERFQRCFFVHLALTGVYPLYKVLYDLIPHGYRGAVVFVLPIWKFGAKRFVVHATRDLEDFIPELVAFSVDFFSALFLSVCMTTSGSIYLSALFISADICQVLLEFREVQNNSNTLLRLVNNRRDTTKRLQDNSENVALLAIILGVARNPSGFRGLQLLFHCEYLALVEYIECVVPLVFVMYKSILEQLPNVVYYPGGAGAWGTTAVTNLVVFAVLEVVSLVFLHFTLQRKCAFSPLYQLAFVLETQVYVVQANLFLETIFLLQYQLEHLGGLY
eukprot:jgi/Phyca11/124800/e_gw1.55.168.1